MNRLILALAAIMALALPIAAAHAQAPSRDQLKEQFRAREADLKDLKKKAVVGETIEGYVAAVAADAAEQKTRDLIAAENADRKVLYQQIADEINKDNPKAPVKATADTIAERNAARNIEKAGPDEMLRVNKDQWIRVKDFPRYQKLAKYKAQGKVGETSTALVEIVKDADRSDKTLASVVDEENQRRREEIKALAEKDHTTEDAAAKRLATRNLANARVGEMVKDGAAWRKK